MLLEVLGPAVREQSGGGGVLDRGLGDVQAPDRASGAGLLAEALPVVAQHPLGPEVVQARVQVVLHELLVRVPPQQCGVHAVGAAHVQHGALDAVAGGGLQHPLGVRRCVRGDLVVQRSEGAVVGPGVGFGVDVGEVGLGRAQVRHRHSPSSWRTQCPPTSGAPPQAFRSLDTASRSAQARSVSSPQRNEHPERPRPCCPWRGRAVLV